MLGWMQRKGRSAGNHWKGNLNYSGVADLIERFLEGEELYQQEWNDFVDTPQKDWQMDVYRRCCYELDPLVNSPSPPDPIALSVLRSIIRSLRDTRLGL
jgi:hypothetical protein